MFFCKQATLFSSLLLIFRTSIIRVAFYVLHAIYPDLPYLSMKTHVSPYILRHWQALGIDKKGLLWFSSHLYYCYYYYSRSFISLRSDKITWRIGDNVKWKKHILDAIWHGDSFFESGTPVLKQTGAPKEKKKNTYKIK